jgi:hypothetical protein
MLNVHDANCVDSDAFVAKFNGRIGLAMKLATKAD